MDLGPSSSEYHAVSNTCSWESQNTGYRSDIFLSCCSPTPHFFFCLFVFSLCIYSGSWLHAFRNAILPFLRGCTLPIIYYIEKTKFVASLFYLFMNTKRKALSQAISEHLTSALFRSCWWQHYLVPQHWVGPHLGRRLLTMSWFLVIFCVICCMHLAAAEVGP